MENKRYKLIQNEDGTLTLIIPEGVRSTEALFPRDDNEERGLSLSP